MHTSCAFAGLIQPIAIGVQSVCCQCPALRVEKPRSREIMNLFSIKRGILCFWAVWMAFVFTTNAADGLKQLHLLPASWASASGNYVLMVKVTSVYQTPAWIVISLFGGVIFWEALGMW